MKTERIIIKDRRFVKVRRDGTIEPVVASPRIIAHLRQLGSTPA